MFYFERWLLNDEFMKSAGLERGFDSVKLVALLGKIIGLKIVNFAANFN